MKALDDIWKDRLYEHEVSYTNNLALMLQPNSFADFHAHPEFVEAFRLWTQKDSFRGLDVARVWSIVLNLKHVLPRGPGSLAELGVYQGQSSALLSFYAAKFGRRIYLADTFQGFAARQFEDDMGEGKKAAFKDTSLEGAQAVVGNYAGIRWIVGVFPDSVTPEMRDDTFAFVSIDCDIYEPIAQGLRFFWPRMVPGGVIFVHDYSSGYWPGATHAVDEFCARNGVSGCLLPDVAGSYVLARPDMTAEPTRPEPKIELSQYYEEIPTSLDQAQTKLARARGKVAQLEQELATMRASRSWRITKPLRMVKHHMRKVFFSFAAKRCQ